MMVHWTLNLAVKATVFVVLLESNLILCLLTSAVSRSPSVLIRHHVHPFLSGMRCYSSKQDVYSSIADTNYKLPSNKRGKGESIDVSQKMVHLLEKMVKTKKFPGSVEFQFDDMQIDEKIKQYKIDLSIRIKDSNLLLLRVAIAAGRRDVCRILMKHGALPLDTDGEGPVFYEALLSDKAGSLHMIRDLLEGINPREVKQILQEMHADLSRASKKYWLERGLKHAFPNTKLSELGLVRLNALKYKIVGQSFALEQILGEVASHRMNSELSSKPLVLLFSGTPGHGKTEMAKQLADLLACPFHKVDCRNHANPWEMFGSGVGYIGSEDGTQLSHFMRENENSMSVVLLDEFDHCDSETWEAFYHVFDEGIFTNKGTKDRNSQGATSQIKCSNTLWLLTTNKFDEDIHAFNDKNIDIIKAYTAGKVQFTDLHDSFDGFIRPKLRSYFKGGLTRRIDAVVPFFKFSEEEAYVIADMYVDRVREMYAKPSNSDRVIGNLDFSVTDHAVGEVSKGYTAHTLDGASAIVRDINNKMIKTIHMQWLRSEGVFSKTSKNNNLRNNTTWIHYTDLNNFHQVGVVSGEQKSRPPYFVSQSSQSSQLSNTLSDNNRQNNDDNDSIEYDNENANGNGSEMPRYRNLNNVRSISLINSKSIKRKSPSLSEEMDLEWESLHDDDEMEVLQDEDESDSRERLNLFNQPQAHNSLSTSASTSASTSTSFTTTSTSTPYTASASASTSASVDDVAALVSSPPTPSASDVISQLLSHPPSHPPPPLSSPLSSSSAPAPALHGSQDREDAHQLDLVGNSLLGERKQQEQGQQVQEEEIGDSSTSVTLDQYLKTHSDSLSSTAHTTLFQHVNLFFDESEENIHVPHFFSLLPASDTITMNEIRDLLCASLQPPLMPEEVRVWVRDTGSVGDNKGAGILFTGTEEHTSSTSQSSSVHDIDDQFERTIGGSRGVKKSAPNEDIIPLEVLERNPYGPTGRILTMEKTDVVKGWRYLRPEMYGTSLSSLCSARSTYPLSSTVRYSEKIDIEEGGTLDLRFELRGKDVREHPYDEKLKEWRNNIKTGDVVDVLFNDSLSLGPVWVEGRVEKVSQRGYGYGGAACTIEMLVAASPEFLEERRIKYNVSPLKRFEANFESFSPNLQPLYSHSENWRAKLDIGSQVYGAIKEGNWLPATVISLVSDGNDGEDRDRDRDSEKEDLISLRLNNIDDNGTQPGGRVVKMIKSMDRYSKNLAMFRAHYESPPYGPVENPNKDGTGDSTEEDQRDQREQESSRYDPYDDDY